MGKPLIRRGINPGALGVPWWRRGPLITEDANCVAHVIWRNGSLIDLKGNSWTMAGTVPQVPESGSVPPGAGPFSIANYYKLGTGVDVLDFAGGTFSLVVIGKMSADPSTVIAGNTDVATAGWNLQTATANTFSFRQFGPAVQVTSGNTAPTGSLFVGCGGRDNGGSLAYVKLNSGTTVTGASASYTSPSAVEANIGTWSAHSFAWVNGIAYELYATTTAPSDALFSGIVAQVAARVRRAL